MLEVAAMPGWDFDSWAAEYDAAVMSEKHAWLYAGYRQVLARVVELTAPVAGETVLDIGAGTGNLGALFLPAGCRVIAVDPSEAILSVARRKFPLLETRPGQFLALPVDSGTVRAAVTSFALHHLAAPEKEQALAEMARVLAPGGRIVIADLMFRDAGDERRAKEELRQQGHLDRLAAIEDEYYGHAAHICATLARLGFPSVEPHHHAGYIWIVRAGP